MSVAFQVPVVYIHVTHACDQQTFFHWLLMIIVTLLDHTVSFTMVHKMSRHITEIIPHTLLIIIIKSEAWTVIHCLRLGHGTMVCAIYLYIFTVLKGVRNTPFPEEYIIDSDIERDIFVMCKYTWIITWNIETLSTNIRKVHVIGHLPYVQLYVFTTLSRSPGICSISESTEPEKPAAFSSLPLNIMGGLAKMDGRSIHWISITGTLLEFWKITH